jgi:hypothetical protein
VIVVPRDDPTRMVGFLTRSDVMAANSRRIHEMRDATREIRIRQTFARRFGSRTRGAADQSKTS